MRTIATNGSVEDLVARTQTITPDSPRMWGSMNAHQMLMHLAGAASAALGEKEFVLKPGRGGALMRVVLLYLMPRYPRGIRVGNNNPAARVVDPATFDRDKQRVIDLTRTLAAPDAAFVPTHPLFGTMSRRNWQRWAYMHTDHHLRQFGA
jgi:hypothetical protein